VSYGTDHWNHFLSSIRNEPEGWSEYKMFYIVRIRGFQPNTHWEWVIRIDLRCAT